MRYLSLILIPYLFYLSLHELRKRMGIKKKHCVHLLSPSLSKLLLVLLEDAELQKRPTLRRQHQPFSGM